MLRTVMLKVNAAHPDIPLERAVVFVGSAASLTIVDVPRSVGKRMISGVWVSVTDVSGTTRAFNAVRVGSAWEVTVPASAVGSSGTVENGIVVAASGKDENGSTVSKWILGAGDLKVMNTDGTVTPGVVRTAVSWFDSAPSSPTKGNIAKIDGVLKIYNGTGWVALGAGDISNSDFEDVDAISDRFTLADVKGKVNEVLGILKGSAAVVLAMACSCAFGDLDVQSARFDSLYNDSFVVTNVTGASGITTNDVESIVSSYTNGFPEKVARIVTNMVVVTPAIERTFAIGNISTNEPGYTFIPTIDGVEGSLHFHCPVSKDGISVGDTQIPYPISDLYVGFQITLMDFVNSKQFTATVTSVIPASPAVYGKYIPDLVFTNDFDRLKESHQSISNAVSQWENYWTGDRVRLSVTNYYGNTSGETPSFMIEESQTNEYGSVTNWVRVWDERTKFTNHVNQVTNMIAVVSNSVMTAAWKQTNLQLANKAPRAWQSVTSAGEDAPDNTVWHTAPKTVFAGGTEYAHVAVGEGSICVLVDKGAPVFTEGAEGQFRFTDESGDNYFGFDVRQAYTIGCNTDGISVTTEEGEYLVSLTYDLTSESNPVILHCTNLVENVWDEETVTWEQNPPAGTKMCYINAGSVPQGFYKAQLQYAGGAKFVTNMQADLAGGIAASNEVSNVIQSIVPVITSTGVVWKVKQ